MQDTFKAFAGRFGGSLLHNRVVRILVLLAIAVALILTPGTVISLDGSSMPEPLFKAGSVPIKTGVEAAAKEAAVRTEEANAINELPDFEIIEIIPDSYIDKPNGNEEIIWNFLLDYGFSDVQAAGIMGNLMQEHRLQTSGHGLAGWMGGRFNKLKAKGNYTSLDTQLNFLMDELNGSYIGVRNRLYSCTNIEQATMVFQNDFERPGIPMAAKRIAFAHSIYNRHHVK